jgi:hypothetical protein
MTTRNVRFIKNPFFEASYLASDEPVPMLKKAADAIADRADGLVRKRTESLADSIEAEVGLDTDDVQTGRVNAHDFKAHWWEFGHRGRVDPFLRPAAESVVGKVSRGDK